ncbi:PGF-CTERM sorting domain-containing protein, partial [Methanolobus psychrotolerans]|uniref:PGF-CTERM sorting domain-containing protein n=1 Tax=Methanolobus psychrotolerans TaxID=1874706 RepID=UPI001A930D56
TIDLYGGMYLKTEDTSSPVLKMTLWMTKTIKAPASADAKVVEEEAVKEDDVVVVDLAEANNEKETTASVDDRKESSPAYDAGDNKVVESSVKAPGFEILIGLLGLLGAAMFRK